MRLRIVSSTENPSEVAVTGTVAKLGKDPSCEVALDADAYPMVSSFHARIERSGADWLLTHLSRSNKTLVNDRPVEGVVKIQEGDRIRLGYTGPFLEILSVDIAPISGFVPDFALSLDSAAKPAPPLPAPVPIAPSSPHPKETSPLPPQTSASAKKEQVKLRRVEKAATKRDPIIRTQATRTLGSLPRGVLWGSVGAAGVIVLAILGFALSRGLARPEPEQPDRLVTNEPEVKPPPPPLPIVSPQKEPAKKPDTKPVVAPPEPPTVDSLAQALKNGPTLARKKALEELGRLGPQARPALAAALDLVKSPDVEVRTLAQETITRMGPPTKDDVPIYAAALRGSAAEVCLFAADQLGALGRHAQSELVFLRVLTLESDTAIREAAVAAVLRIEADLLSSLMQGLQDKSDSERHRCAKELALMGANAKAAIPNLVLALADGNSSVRVAVREVFVAIGPDAVMVLGEGLRDRNVDVRLNAIYTLGRMGPDARFVLPELIAVAYDNDVKAKEEALGVIAKIGDHAIPYLLQSLEREKNLARQKAILEALDRVGHDAGPAVQTALKSAKPEVAKLSAKVLKNIESQPAQPARAPHTGPVLLIQEELHAWFKSVDTNKNGFLEKHELAHAFRGPDAKSFDYNPDGKTPKNLGTNDFAKYPDFAFLCRLDRNNDGRISWSEFEHWAYGSAEFIKRDADERERIMKARKRLMEPGLSEAVRKQREITLTEAWKSYQDTLRVQQHSHHLGWPQQWVLNRPQPKR